MTRENTHFRGPLDEKSMAEAQAYLKKSEKKGKGHVFLHFKEDVLKYIASTKQGPISKFNHTFVEYVILEVTEKSFHKMEPPECWVAALWDSWFRFRTRMACKRRCGVTQKYHAAIYHDFICNALMEAGVHRTFLHTPYFDHEILF